ncbi:MAG: hypothetical protein UY48_C0011G0025 [Candidatus Gottesmanbacteria bacterium GW2011_GWB1_49_7]|uniref:Uncharacterized protein n=1 Tax=Candidatus Gottesmanbacteria bacterium GW2011_GWB1_49_7 TaxID=1618448 RepID=A0A0G1W1H1_9BACT|nr:MAG: hypothetical protein UY48_C0011G0025 [Candidatus Gottesmanbacteria bacterium GW2011_GWB1_49_7]
MGDYALAQCSCEASFNVAKKSSIESTDELNELLLCCDTPDIWGVLPRNADQIRPKTAWTWRIVRLKEEKP